MNHILKLSQQWIDCWFKWQVLNLNHALNRAQINQLLAIGRPDMSCSAPTLPCSSSSTPDPAPPWPDLPSLFLRLLFHMVSETGGHAIITPAFSFIRQSVICFLLTNLWAKHLMGLMIKMNKTWFPKLKMLVRGKDTTRSSPCTACTTVLSCQPRRTSGWRRWRCGWSETSLGRSWPRATRGSSWTLRHGSCWK